MKTIERAVIELTVVIHIFVYGFCNSSRDVIHDTYSIVLISVGTTRKILQVKLLLKFLNFSTVIHHTNLFNAIKIDGLLTIQYCTETK